MDDAPGGLIGRAKEQRWGSYRILQVALVVDVELSKTALKYESVVAAGCALGGSRDRMLDWKLRNHRRRRASVWCFVVHMKTCDGPAKAAASAYRLTVYGPDRKPSRRRGLKREGEPIGCDLIRRSG